ncbi:outer membrane beta-barrel protein [Gemmatimonas groenlandica]|uniref:Outer membrane beta-barrel protein n=1 Tax=Gemmatimonas groenlandica TaxID=2732249 RepID=A0A6M4IRH9_9BACT|nr:outer membrane beta-barrel protein [Gemmatimonas groenlandica]QJR36369.1 outer membrane beta-barrel protein [Gemmatimonas groenlandica]
MHISVRRAALTFVALLVAAPAVGAQALSPSTLGISAAVHGVGGTMNTAIYPGASGSTALGFGGEIAYGASPRLSLVGRLARIASKSEIITESTDYAVLQGDLGLRWMSSPGARVRPFAEAGLALRRLAFEYPDNAGVTSDFSAFNGGATVSVGVMVFQTDKMSVEGAGTYTSGNFSTWKVNGKAESLAQMTSEMFGVRLGVRYWFKK